MNEAAKYHNGSWVHHLLENPTKSLEELLEDPTSNDAYYRRKPIVPGDKPASVHTEKVKSNAPPSESRTGNSMFASVNVAGEGEDNGIFGKHDDVS